MPSSPLTTRAMAIPMYLLLLAAGCDAPGVVSIGDRVDTLSQGGRTSRTPGFAALGASTTFGIGASDPATTGSTALFADYLATEYFERDINFVNVAVPGATSQEILDQQTRDRRLGRGRRHRRKQVMWLASGGNDLLALINTPGALDPCAQPPEVPELGVSFACYDAFREVTTAYEHNLRETVRRMRRLATRKRAVILLRTELNGLDEVNCLEDGAIDAQGNVFLPPQTVAALRPLGDLALEGLVPPIPELGFQGFKGINPIMRNVAAEFNAVVIDTFTVFKVAALSGGDLVSRDCIHPNDDGHAAILDLAVAAFEEAVAN